MQKGLPFQAEEAISDLDSKKIEYHYNTVYYIYNGLGASHFPLNALLWKYIKTVQ